jgi:hypothetical protein
MHANSTQIILHTRIILEDVKLHMKSVELNVAQHAKEVRAAWEPSHECIMSPIDGIDTLATENSWARDMPLTRFGT